MSFAYKFRNLVDGLRNSVLVVPSLDRTLHEVLAFSGLLSSVVSRLTTSCKRYKIVCYKITKICESNGSW